VRGFARRGAELALYAAAPLAIFVTSPLLAQGLGTSGRGELGIIQSVLSIAIALGSLGQAEVFLADLRVGSHSLRASSRLALGGGALSAVAALLVSTSLGVNVAAAVAAAVFIPIISQSQLWRSFAVSQHHLVRPAASSAVAAVLRISLIAILAVCGLLTPLSAISAIQFSLAVGVLATLGWYVFRAYPHSSSRIPVATYLDHFRRGAPMLFFAALTSVTLRGDLFFLNAFADTSTLGIYAAASSLSMSVLAVSGAFKSRIQSAVFRPNPSKGVFTEIALILILGLMGAAVATLGAPWIVDTLLGPGYDEAVPLIRILALASVALLVLDAVHGLLAVLGLRKSMLLVAAIGAATTAVALTIFIPLAGAPGAAWATLVSYTVAAIAGILIATSNLRRERRCPST
jgi:PST family polysaccharide transporter